MTLLPWLVVSAALATEPRPEDCVEARGMAVLGSWAGVNLVGGTTAGLLSQEPSWRSFHLTNAAWNTVNAGLAIGGGVSLARRSPTTGAERAEHAAQLQRVLAINAALDGVYIASGALVYAIGQQQARPEWVGVGASLGLQGAFLLGFDLGLRARHRSTTIELGLTPSGVSGRF